MTLSGEALAALLCVAQHLNPAAFPVLLAGDQDSVPLRDQELRRLDSPCGDGARSSWAELGLAIECALTADASAALAGGAAPGGSAVRDRLDLVLSLDTGAAFGVAGGTFGFGFESIAGENGSEEFGVLQAFSNIDAEDRTQLSRVWYEQRLAVTGTALSFGKLDANSLFAYVDGGAGFLHSSMGYSPTILGLPTYPDPAFGVALAQDVAPGWLVSLGLFDGAGRTGVPTGSRGPATVFGEPNALFLIGEIEHRWAGGRAAVGAWEHTARFERFDGGEDDGARGFHAMLDQCLARPNAAAAGARGVEAFVQLGCADPDVSAIEFHIGTGLVWTPNDSTSSSGEFGVGISFADLSGESSREFDESHETACEVYWELEPATWLRAKPDLQYVANPGGRAENDDAVIFTLRLVASL